MTTVVLLALASAASYGVASVLQHQATEREGEELAMRVGLLVRLVRSRRWLLGNVGDVVGFVLQLLALRHGPVTLVEPLLVTSLVFAFPVAAIVRHQRVPWAEPAAAVVVTGGLVLFLAVARPGPGRAEIPTWQLVALVAATAVVVGGLVLAARRSERRRAGLLLAVAGGISFGTMAAAVSITWQVVDHGVLTPSPPSAPTPWPSPGWPASCSPRALSAPVRSPCRPSRWSSRWWPWPSGSGSSQSRSPPPASTRSSRCWGSA